jgi:m7GpppX diphosphatase
LVGFKTTVIYPATEKHIRKYEAQNIHLIEETPELYECVTLPYLEKERFSVKVNIEK